MHAKDFLVYYSCYRQAVETIGKSLPQLDIVSPLACVSVIQTKHLKIQRHKETHSNQTKSLTLVVETVDTVDRGALMIAAKDEEILGIFDLVR